MKNTKLLRLFDTIRAPKSYVAKISVCWLLRRSLQFQITLIRSKLIVYGTLSMLSILLNILRRRFEFLLIPKSEQKWARNNVNGAEMLQKNVVNCLQSSV